MYIYRFTRIGGVTFISSTQASSFWNSKHIRGRISCKENSSFQGIDVVQWLRAENGMQFALIWAVTEDRKSVNAVYIFCLQECHLYLLSCKM